jgi:hypothetical protein
MIADWLETELAASEFEDYRIGCRISINEIRLISSIEIH